MLFNHQPVAHLRLCCLHPLQSPLVRPLDNAILLFVVRGVERTELLHHDVLLLLAQRAAKLRGSLAAPRGEAGRLGLAPQGLQGLGEPEQGLGPVVAEAQRQGREVEAGLVVPQVELDEGEVGEQPARLRLLSNFRSLGGNAILFMYGVWPKVCLTLYTEI